MDQSHIFTRTKLSLACVLPIALLAARILYTGQTTHLHMAWNLFLAWLPLLFAYLTLYAWRQHSMATPIFAVAWLLFLPNAPYLVTDIIHMPYHNGMSALYDAVLLFVFAMGGMFLGVASLRWMQDEVASIWGQRWGQGFALGIIGLTGFGIYIGRYLRWNSWDIVANPTRLIGDIYPFFTNPLQNWQVWVFSMLFATVFAFAYWLLPAPPMVNESAPVSNQSPRRGHHHNRFDLVPSNNKKRRVY